MIREIKFRAWGHNGDKKQMLHFDIFMSQLDDTMKYRIRVGDFPVMEFTGLKDKNGKEIYESDIVRGDWHWDGWRPHVIEWPDDGYDLRESCLGGEDLEVLGNIYENPDLLEMK